MGLNSRAFGLALGLVYAGFWLIVMAISLLTGLGDLTVQLWGSFYYPFFDYTWGGLVITVAENFVYGLVGGWIFAWLYNRFAK